ncbi:MAG: hypothetical protein O2868_18675 [Proteobacteria bacterium]|nr:hypothetical protein [Pseudomonadota bacterium]
MKLRGITLLTLAGGVLVYLMSLGPFSSDANDELASQPALIATDTAAIGIAPESITAPLKAEPPPEIPLDPNDLSQINLGTYFGKHPGVAALQHDYGELLNDMFTRRSGTLSPQQVERFNELHIVPWNPKIAEDCEEILTPVPGTRCRDVYERPHSHDYEALSIEELRSMPAHDAAAPYYLALKTSPSISRDEVLDLMYRAAAMADKPGELLQYSTWLAASGKKGAEDLRVRYVLEKVASAMGDERSRPELIWQDIESVASKLEDPQKFLEQAESDVAARLASMNRARLEVFGLPITMRGNSDDNSTTISNQSPG